MNFIFICLLEACKDVSDKIWINVNPQIKSFVFQRSEVFITQF
jgi:hypothetical protein